MRKFLCSPVQRLFPWAWAERLWTLESDSKLAARAQDDTLTDIKTLSRRRCEAKEREFLTQEIIKWNKSWLGKRSTNHGPQVSSWLSVSKRLASVVPPERQVAVICFFSRIVWRWKVLSMWTSLLKFTRNITFSFQLPDCVTLLTLASFILSFWNSCVYKLSKIK